MLSMQLPQRGASRASVSPRCQVPPPLTSSYRPRKLAARPCASRVQLRLQAFQATKTLDPETAASNAVDRLAEQLVDTGKQARLSWAGAGIFFFWQLGALKYLAEHYDLTKVPMAGASGGALAAVLAACNVDADKVLDAAYTMSVEEGIWDRKFGLLGVWGSFIERWLDHLLPDNAAEMCRGRVTIVVTKLPLMTQIGINDFRDKKDLINICMASAHVPLFLDFKLARKVRGMYCMDGSLPDFFYNDNCDILKADAVIFDYFEDPELKRNGRFEMLELKSYEEVLRINQCGYDFARKLEERGMLQAFDKAGLVITPPSEGNKKHHKQQIQHKATASSEQHGRHAAGMSLVGSGASLGSADAL